MGRLSKSIEQYTPLPIGLKDLGGGGYPDFSGRTIKKKLKKVLKEKYFKILRKCF